MASVGGSAICKLTGMRGDFADAHIVPKAFYAYDQRIKIFGAPSDRPARSLSGLYDSQLVIRDTESKILSPLDNYAIRFLRKEVGDWRTVIDDGEIVGFFIGGVDQKLLKLFYLSVFWRAHASARKELQDFDLGTAGQELALAIKDRDPGPVDRHPVQVTVLYDIDPKVIPVAPPFLADIDGQRAAVAIFGGARVSFYLDGRPPESEFGFLCSDEPLVVISEDWRGSSLRAIAQRQVLESYQRFGSPFQKRPNLAKRTSKKK